MEVIQESSPSCPHRDKGFTGVESPPFPLVQICGGRSKGHIPIATIAGEGMGGNPTNGTLLEAK